MFRSKGVLILFNVIASGVILSSIAVLVFLFLERYYDVIFCGAVLGSLASLLTVIGCVAPKK